MILLKKIDDEQSLFFSVVRRAKRETRKGPRAWLMARDGNLRALHALEDLEPLFKIFYTFVCKKVPGKITDKYMENLKQASGEI